MNGNRAGLVPVLAQAPDWFCFGWDLRFRMNLSREGFGLDWITLVECPGMEPF